MSLRKLEDKKKIKVMRRKINGLSTNVVFANKDEFKSSEQDIFESFTDFSSTKEVPLNFKNRMFWLNYGAQQ